MYWETASARLCLICNVAMHHGHIAGQRHCRTIQHLWSLESFSEAGLEGIINDHWLPMPPSRGMFNLITGEYLDPSVPSPRTPADAVAAPATPPLPVPAPAPPLPTPPLPIPSSQEAARIVCCGICLQDLPTIGLQPCYHCICPACFQCIGARCPFCRLPITGRVPLRFP